MVIGNPFPLKANSKKSFMGTVVLGKGFILKSEEAKNLIVKDPRNKNVLFPYLNGDDLNNDPGQNASRWIINFFDWPEEKARTYPDCFAILEGLVKPERQRPGNKMGREKWWQYYRRGVELYETISKLDQVMVIAQVSKTLAFTFVPRNQVISMMCIVFSFDDYFTFGLVQNSLHQSWVQKYASALKSDTRYTPSDVFETYPLPQNIDPQIRNKIAELCEEYYLKRKALMCSIQIGLTKTYNLFHSKSLNEVKAESKNVSDKEFEKDNGKETLWLKRHLQNLKSSSYNDAVGAIRELRYLQVKIDGAILEAYRWNDIQPKHDFYELENLPENDRIRFAIHPDVRKNILKRLLNLNNQLHAAEIDIYEGPSETFSEDKNMSNTNIQSKLF
jgi:hypothetical protein